MLELSEIRSKNFLKKDLKKKCYNLLKNMPKTKVKKGLFRLVYFQTVVALAAYFLFSNFVFLGSVAYTNIYVSFFVTLVFGVLSSFVFLYLFGHRGFFPFIGKFEREEGGNEKKYLHKFIRYGRVAACILVSAVGGPIFLALTIRFLFLKSENRYLMAFISTLISTAFMIAFAKGLFSFIF